MLHELECTDECSSFYDNENFTMQWCLLAESLRNSVHDKGKHGYGGIWGGKKASFHHNLLADHDSRNPRFCGSRYSNKPELELVDFRNNVIYNWGSNSSYGAEGGSYNMVNNYFKAGPATKSNTDRIENPNPDDGSNNQPAGVYGLFYIDGNYMTASETTTNNNWLGVDLASSFSTYGITKNDLKSEAPFSTPVMTMQTAEKAYEQVLKYVGASLARDTVDKRIIHDTETGIASIMDGGNGSTDGLIDTQNAVGGWPELNSTTAPADADLDGMPDDWEDANGLNKNSSDDAHLTTVDGEYPNIEVYLNSLVAHIVDNQNEGGELTTSVISLKAKDNPLKIFYNGNTQELNISHSSKIQKIRLYSLTGSLIREVSSNQNELQVQLPQLKSGIYLVRITDEKKICHSGKFVVTQ